MHIKRLGEKLAQREGQSVNMTEWFRYLTFDIMGDLAFGKGFGMLESGERHYVMKMLHEGQKPLAFLGPVPWLTRILTKVPGPMEKRERFKKWCKSQVIQRKEVCQKLLKPGRGELT